VNRKRAQEIIRLANNLHKQKGKKGHWTDQLIFILNQGDSKDIINIWDEKKLSSFVEALMYLASEENTSK